MPLTTFEVPPAYARLTAGDPVKNASAILRNALPINNKPIREAQVATGLRSIEGGAGRAGDAVSVAPPSSSSNPGVLTPRCAPHPSPQPPLPLPLPQRDLESITEQLRVPGSKSLGPISRSVRGAQSVVTSQRDKIAADFAPAKRADGEAALAKLEASLVEFQAIIDAKDKQVAGRWGAGWGGDGPRPLALRRHQAPRRMVLLSAPTHPAPA
jgi:hypothetical protein